MRIFPLFLILNSSCGSHWKRLIFLFETLPISTINIGLASITQLGTCVINSNIQGWSPNVGKSDFPYNKELLLKERIRSLWEQILSFKTSSHFEKGHN